MICRRGGHVEALGVAEELGDGEDGCGTEEFLDTSATRLVDQAAVVDVQ